MLSPGSRKASSACLRCQLRQLIAGRETRVFPGSTQRRQPFSRTSIRPEELHPQLEAVEESRNRHGSYTIRPDGIAGRITGRPGRRRREESKRLLIKSLGRSTDVILLKDVEEAKGPAATPVIANNEAQDAALNAEAIKAAIANDGSAPKQDEVNTHIEALRPSGDVLDHGHFANLSKQLVESYNLRQLAGYLVHALRGGGVPKKQASREAGNGDKALPVSQWRTGKSPIDKRHQFSALAKRDIRKSKAGIANQIIRLAWGVTDYSEEQKVGELEVRLKGWQMAALFDVAEAGVSNIEKFVGSELLMRSSEITPYRPNSIMRITARRHDAEEILRRLERGLSAYEILEINLRRLFKPRNVPRKLEDMFLEKDLKYVSESTGAVIALREIMIQIYHPDEKARFNTRRLLLALTDLSDPANFDARIPEAVNLGKSKHSTTTTTSSLGLQFAAPHVHRRHRRFELVRPTHPIVRSQDTKGRPHAVTEIVKSELSQKLSKMQAFKNDATATTTFNISHTPWVADVCLLTKEIQPNETGAKLWSRRTVQVHQVPGTANVFSYFTPKKATEPATSGGLTLIAHFTPSPFAQQKMASWKRLPRVKMIFKMTRDGAHGSRNLHLENVSAELERRTQKASLPYDAADLYFQRSAVMDLAATGGVNDVTRFTQQLQDSVASSTGYLDGIPEVKFKLPAGIAKELRATETNAGVHVEYLLDGFEQVQEIDFVPLESERGTEGMDPALAAAFKAWPKDVVLRRREVDAGAFGGKRTELTLVQTNPDDGVKQADGTADSDSTGGLVSIAVDFAGLITRANNGLLKPLEETCPTLCGDPRLQDEVD